jgi:L-rhamnose-H+ transport protein
MSADIWIGMALILMAAIAVGNCMLPLKFTRVWKWENTWLVFSLVSLVVIPWAMAAVAIPDPAAVYARASLRELAVPFLFGAGWGIAQVLFGLTIVRLGMALGYAIIIGLGAMLGTLVPLVAQHPELLGTAKGVLVFAAMAIMIGGIAVCSWAGRQREKGARSGGVPVAGSYAAGVAIAVVCGVMAPMINFSLAFGQGLADSAMRQGVSAANASYAVWPVGLAGGLVANLLYSIYLLGRNQTWGNFRRLRPDFFLAALMGVLWMGSVGVYGMAAGYLGELGTSVGWGIYQILMILAANLSGLLTGEWAGAGRWPVRALWAGLGLLATAVVLMALVNL